MSMATVEWDACVLEPHPNRELEEYVTRRRTELGD